VSKDLPPWTPWITFAAGAILAYLLSGASDVARLQQTIQAQEQTLERQDQVMTGIVESFCNARVDLDYYHLITLRNWRDASEKAAMQAYAGAELDLCRWHWVHPNELPPWKAAR
jgi:hypothetical protein